MILYIQPGYMGRVFPDNWPSKVQRGRNETKPSCVCVPVHVLLQSTKLLGLHLSVL
jgi:hypothetical protein